MSRWLAAGLALWPATALAQQAATPPAAARTAQGDVAVTIYSNGVALVQDRRQMTLPAGVSRQEFPDVSNNIRPATVRLSADGVEVVEQNYDYDLLSPSALMAKAVGQTITLIRTNPATGAETREQARVLATNGGVILETGGHIEVLRDDGLPVRVLFSSLPPSLRARPTLSITLDARAGGARPVTLSYLTGGMSWAADYVALFDEAKQTLDMQGWITLANQSEVPFVDADTVLVAGAPGGDNEQQGYSRYSYNQPRRGTVAVGTQAGTETAGRARLGDFYLYPLGHRTTLAANQQKQVSFLSAGAVAARRGYEYRNGWLAKTDEPVSASSIIGFSTARGGGLGDALPAGTVRVYLRDASGQPQFVGEDRVGHTPMGTQLSLRTGDAFDVNVAVSVEKRERILSDEWERTARFRISVDGGRPTVYHIDDAVTYWRTSMRYVLTNAKPQPVTVDLIQGGLDQNWYWHDTRVPLESQRGEQRSLDERVWHVTVPANGQTVLTASFDTRY